VLVGGPQKVADELQNWMDETDIDGFSELTTRRVAYLQTFAT